MLKSLTYAALGLGGAALATALVLSTASVGSEQKWVVTFEANGGTFTGTNQFEVVNTESYTNCFSNVFEKVRVEYKNHDFLSWTNSAGRVEGSDPITNNVTLFAEWRRSAIQSFDITNGVFEAAAGEVAQFPAVFLGVAKKLDEAKFPTKARIRFVSPEDKECRISFDPSSGMRVSGEIAITNLTSGVGKSYPFGDDEWPVNFGPNPNETYSFKRGETNDVYLTLDKNNWGSGVREAHYAIGIGLEGCIVKYDPTEYGDLKNWDFYDKGINVSTNYPIGINLVPTLNASSRATFSGWYTEEDGRGTRILATDSPGDITKLYAYWKFSSYTYYVDFKRGGEGVKGSMPQQIMQSDKQTTLYRNRYYKEGWRFDCWKDAFGTEYANGALITNNLCARPYATNELVAVWQKSSANYFVVSPGETNFWADAVTPGAPAYFDAIGTPALQPFLLNVTNMTNAVSCRVAIDPPEGYDRKSAIKLSIEKQGETNWVEVVSNITEFAVTTNMYSFTNGVYRFNVTGATSNDAYVVTLGASGVQIDFEPFVRARESYNWTVDSPYGYLPALTTSAECDQFLGWYDSPVATTSNKIEKTEIATTNATAWARWSKYPYWVAFDKGTNTAEGAMTPQLFYHDKPDYLKRNEYYVRECRFEGWTTNGCTSVVYRDGALVTNLYDTAGGTNTLCAVWTPTPGTNWYYVAGGTTNFGTIAVSQGSPTLFVGKGDVMQFMVTKTNVAKCRVSIDPQEGFPRVGAKLTIDCAEIPTNATEKLEWKSACDAVTDLSEKEVTCAFTTNLCYRFTITGVANTNGYVVSIGAEGARYIFDVCGGDFVGEEKTTKVKFYNWTVGMPIGYTPPVTTNAYVHGTNTWHYTPQYLTKAEERELGVKQFSTTNLVVSCGEKLYAHWSDAVIVPIIFDWNLQNLAATNIVFTNYYAQGANVYLYRDAYVRQPVNDSLGFLGWTTNATTTAGWNIDEGKDLKPVTTNSPNYFYAQWTKEWKTSRTEAGGLSIDGYFKTPEATFGVPVQVYMANGILWPVEVSAIGDSAFASCSAIKVLNIHKGITYVGDSAFEDCTSLTTVTFEEREMPDEHTEIGDGGFLDGVFDSASPTVELGECLFKGCASLVDIELPLGVCCIPNECFSGCTAMTSFDNMPYTVIEIGTEAFYGCTHLTNVVHTEIVDKIGEGAFRKCARMKFVSFIGDNPEAVESDIFERTPRNVLVRYLENMCETAKDYCGGSWPALPALWPVAGATNSSRTVTWLGGKYPRRKVIFNYNDNDVLWKSTQVPVLYHKDRVFGLLAPTEEEMNGGTNVKASNDDEEGEEEEEITGFSGWYTQPMGGRKVGNYWVVPTALKDDSDPITVYAHWGEEEGEGAEMGSRGYGVYYGHDENTEDFETFPGFYSVENEDEGIEGDDMFYYSACTFNGIVIDLENENAITGTVEFVFKDATYPKDGGMQSAFTATVTWNTGKKTTISGVADAEGYLVANGGKWSLGKEGDEHRTVITKSGLNGWLSNEDSEFRIYAARNRTAQATEGAARTVVLTGLQATKGTWHVVLGSEASESAFTDGYSTMAITIANMGQATIEGTLVDGTKVSTSSTLIIGDGCCCLPVSIKSGKGGFAFMLWFTWQSDGSFSEEEDDVSVKGLTSWTLSDGTTVEFSEVGPLTFIDEKRYSGPAKFEAEISATINILGTNATWKVDGDNENKLTLRYNSKTGIFTGSYIVDERKAAVNGVFTDRINEDLSDTYTGYGTAVIKGEGSVPVKIEPESTAE